jgi:hypothetical protein
VIRGNVLEWASGITSVTCGTTPGIVSGQSFSCEVPVRDLLRFFGQLT